MKHLVGIIVLSLLATVVVPTMATAHEGSHEVVVDDFAFTPKVLQIDPGETVTWHVREDGHTITSDDVPFDWSVRNGESRTHPFEHAGRFNYYCKVHPGMTGAIQVGEPVLTCPDCPLETRVVPSSAFPDLENALSGAPEQTLIEIRPGRYDIYETLELSRPGVTLRGTNEDGTPAAPGAVELRGRGGAAVGISISAVTAEGGQPVAVESLTVTGFLDSGIEAVDAKGFRIKNVRAVDNLEYGIRTVTAMRGAIAGSYASGHRRAGISVEVCESCDVRVEGSTAEDNFIGLQAENAGSLVVRRSTFKDNASGIVLRSVTTSAPHLQQGAHVYNNDLTGNSATDVPARSVYSTTAAMELPVGAGIWVQGGWHDIVENNRVDGSHYGIIVTASSANSFRSKVLGNVLAGNQVDLGWDGLGADVCFSGNSGTTSEPAAIQTLYPCGAKATIGAPYPKVTADLGLYAIRNFYCREADERTCI